MLEICSISKNYTVNGAVINALKEISFDISEPMIFGVMGKSGIGKTTLLRLIAGLIKPSSGIIRLHNKNITGPTKKIGMVFQDYGAFPWLTVSKNIDFGLKLNNIPTNKRKTITNKLLDEIELIDQSDHYPNRLSGGQKQRLAIARALAVEPDVLLMDEPFGALDRITKVKIKELILSIWKQKQFIIILVTHDFDEASTTCHKIITLK